MQCPVCRKHTMGPTEAAHELTGQACSGCAGVWIDRTRYESWRTRHPADVPATDAPVQLAAAETRGAKVCPSCGRLLLPYRVGHGLPFSIDYCGGCGGVWCDGGEWEAIKAKGLHGRLHDIVSRDWQAAVRRADVQQSIEQTYARHLGGGYARAREFKTWLQAQPQKALILTYLADAP